MIRKYALIHRLIHWFMAIAIISLLAVGLYMTSLDSDNSIKYDLYGLHKSIGVTVLGLLALRLLSRALTYIPPMPKKLSWLEKNLARAIHFLLYVAMAAMPLTGIIMSNSAGYSVKWFSIELPRLVEKNSEMAALMNDLHTYGAYILIGFISLHVLGALKHRFVDKKNDVLPRMI